jgi:D-xylose transport system substrate-binding protein
VNITNLNIRERPGSSVARKSLGRRKPLRVATVGLLLATVGMLGSGGAASASTSGSMSVSTSDNPAGTSDNPADTVAILFPDNTTPRWMSEDAPDFKGWMHRLDPSSKVIVDVANEDPSEQLSEAQSALTQGAKVLVVIAVDGVQAAKIVQDAQADHMPVIAYTREIYNAPVKYMTGDDPYQIGLALGNWMAAHTKAGDHVAVIAGSTTDSFAHLEYSGYMHVMSPLFKSGARKEVGPVWTPEWDTTKAHDEMAAFLTETHNNIQAVLCANDSTAEGAISALQSVGLAGKIPVTGIDATLASDQLILKGYQSMSVWRSVDNEAKYTAQLVVDLFKHQAPPKGFFTGTINNGYGAHPISRIIPMKAVPSTVITASNMQELITAHAIIKSQLCQGIPHGTGPC